jgi:hypothetical protein
MVCRAKKDWTLVISNETAGVAAYLLSQWRGCSKAAVQQKTERTIRRLSFTQQKSEDQSSSACPRLLNKAGGDR